MDRYPGATQTNFLGRDLAKGKIINTGGSARVKSKVIDGFVKAPQTAARGLHQRGQKAQTLMRGALQKPTAINQRGRGLKTNSNPMRELRAKQTAQHSQVDRFGGFVSSLKSAERASKKPLLQGEVINRSADNSAKSPARSPILPSMVASASHARLERMLDEALTKADAHKQALKYQAARHFWQKPGFFSKKRWLKLSILALVVFGVSLGVAWQRVPELSVKLASLRAHVDASIPSYKPAGYSLSGPAKAANHAVTIQYAASDDKSKVYTVEEQPSNQDSTSLIADSSSPDHQVQTAQANGIPIVIIQNKVMCVSNGLKTTITNEASLSSDELLNIAKAICS